MQPPPHPERRQHKRQCRGSSTRWAQAARLVGISIYLAKPFAQIAAFSRFQAPPVRPPPAESFSQAVPQFQAPESGSKTCPACGASNPPGEAFCQICGFGFAVQQQANPLELPVPVTTTAFVAPAAAAAEIVSGHQGAGRLLSAATNISLPLPEKTEIVLGRLDPDRNIYPDIDLTDQGSASTSVSRRHARLVVQGSQVFVEDMNSTNSTYLNRQRLQPGQRFLLNPGDELRLGGVILVYYAD